MLIRFLLIACIILSSKIYASHAELSPLGISLRESNILITLENNQYRVFDVFYEENSIFKIAGNLLSVINSMIVVSKHNNARLTYKLFMSDNIITSTDELNKILIVSPLNYQFVKVSAENFILTSSNYSNKKYKLKLILNSRKKKYKIYKSVYEELEKIKLMAQNQNLIIKVNLNFFSIKNNFNLFDEISRSFLLVDP